MPPFSRQLPLVLSIALAAGACRERVPKPSIELTSCRLEGFPGSARCGVHEVYEDRKAGQGRRLSLDVAVIPAHARKARAEPLFVLVGGPGQAATRAGPALAAALAEVSRERDLVLVDQRGTGGSHALDCTPADYDPEEIRFDDLLPEDEMAACRERLEADLRLYTTPVAVEDLDEVRAALGYEKLSLWGGSYGTRLALEYLRRKPDRVRSVVLDGVVPTTMRLPLSFGRDGQRALDLLLTACEADEACRASYPALGARLDRLLERLEAEPAQARLAHPRSGRPLELTVRRQDFVLGLQKLLYAPALSSLLPATIDRAAEGDFAPFIAQLSALSSNRSGRVAVGLLVSVTCTEDVAFFDEQEAAREATGAFLGDGYAKAFLRACKSWPRGELPGDFHTPVASEAPVLILSGALDPVTPPSWGERVAQTLPNARHIVVPGAGHGASGVGCVPHLIAEFLSGGPADLDAGCAERHARPPFFLDFAGPQP